MMDSRAGRGRAALVACCVFVGGSCAAGSSSPATTTRGNVETVLPHQPWIAYQLYGTTFSIRLIRPDGTGDHALLPASSPEQMHPDWSPDGSHLTYVTDHAIWVVGADGSDNRQVVACASPCRDLDFPAWSPDGSRIVFSRVDLVDGKNPGSILETVDVSSGTVRDVFRTQGAEYAQFARWSRDGRSLVIELDRYVDDSVAAKTIVGSALGVVDVASSAVRMITDWADFAAYPDWSPKDDLIVFSTLDLGARDGGSLVDPSPPSDLYTIRPDGSGLTRLTHNASSEVLVRNNTASGPLSSQPTWSRDGQSIMLVQVDGAEWPGWTMAIMHNDGSGLGPATGSAFRRGTHPRPRPD